MEAWQFVGGCSRPAQLLRLSIPAAPAAGCPLVSPLTLLRSVGLTAAAPFLTLWTCLVCLMWFPSLPIYPTSNGFLWQIRTGWSVLGDSGKCGMWWVGGSNPLFTRLSQIRILGALPIPPILKAIANPPNGAFSHPFLPYPYNVPVWTETAFSRVLLGFGYLACFVGLFGLYGVVISWLYFNRIMGWNLLKLLGCWKSVMGQGLWRKNGRLLIYQEGIVVSDWLSV